MKFYTIENETNNITVHTSAKEAQAVPDAQRFTTETTFARLAAEWPTSRFIAIWNTLPGVIPVRGSSPAGNSPSPESGTQCGHSEKRLSREQPNRRRLASAACNKRQQRPQVLRLPVAQPGKRPKKPAAHSAERIRFSPSSAARREPT